MIGATDPSRLASVALQRIGHRRALVALDHDGTLAPIVARPDEAVLAAGAMEVLRSLGRSADVAIISGRALDDLMARFPQLPVTLVAEHGLRLRSVDGEVSWLVDGLPDATLDALRAELMTVLTATEVTDGWLVEDKHVTIAVHHRLVADDALEPTLTRVRAALDRAATAGGHVQAGKSVLELRPSGADKGAALRSLLERHEGGTAIMVGDDLTDEGALAVAEASGGLGVLVAESPRASAASARLPDPAAVVTFLEHLDRALRQG